MADDFYDVEALTAGANSTVTITDDGTGIDWLSLTGIHRDYSTFRLEWLVSSGVSQQARVTYFNPDNSSYSLVVNGLIENVRGSIGADWVNGNEANNLIFGDQARGGAGGSDTLGGHTGNDTIYGGAGNDEISGSYDDDQLFGDAGNDLLYGGDGTDILQGGAGADSLYGGSNGSDWVSYSQSKAAVQVVLIAGSNSTASTGGDAAGDLIYGINNVIGSNFNDTLTDSPLSNANNANVFRGLSGNDILNLGGNNDSGYGGIGNDSLYGGTGNDTLHGEDGIDRLEGGAGNDSLYGGNGADRLIGGSGLDRLYGGLGADRFVFVEVADSTALPSARDVIYDFNRAQGDKIDLTAIDTNLALANDQQFFWRGSAGFDGTLGALRAVNSGANTLVMADMNGDRITDFSFVVIGVNNMASTDFML